MKHFAISLRRSRRAVKPTNAESPATARAASKHGSRARNSSGKPPLEQRAHLGGAAGVFRVERGGVW